MTVRILQGDVRERLAEMPADHFDCIVTSPPYWGLRDYGVAGQIGLEPTLSDYLDTMVAVCGELRRVLKPSGTFWLNIGDCYSGGGRGGNPGYSPHVKQRTNVGSIGAPGAPTVEATGLRAKNLCMVPARLALRLQDDGWWLRDQVIWAKPNGMPGSQEDRCTSSHESILFLTKGEIYWSDFDAIKTPPRESTLVRLAQDVQAQAHRANGGAKSNGPMKAVAGQDKQRGHGRRHAGFNTRWDAMQKREQQAAPAMMRNVWFVSPSGYDEAHFAVMPEEIARRCILAGCPYGGHVLDPFGGAGTTGMVADRLGRDATLIELNPKYIEIARKRLTQDAGMFAELECA